MKTKAIVATLLVAAAASADARLASPFPRKAVPPDESGHWIVINGNPWPYRRSNCIASPLPLPQPQVLLAFGGCLARPPSSSLTFQTTTMRRFTFSEMSVFERLRKNDDYKT